MSMNDDQEIKDVQAKVQKLSMNFVRLFDVVEKLMTAIDQVAKTVEKQGALSATEAGGVQQEQQGKNWVH